MEHKFSDVRLFWTDVCEHTCPDRLVAPENRGTDIGFKCQCGAWFGCALNSIKAIRTPLRPYIRTTQDREVSAQRINQDPAGFLKELQLSGGWDQPDPGVAFMTTLAAAMGPEGNPMSQALQKMFEPLEVGVTEGHGSDSPSNPTSSTP